MKKTHQILPENDLFYGRSKKPPPPFFMQETAVFGHFCRFFARNRVKNDPLFSLFYQIRDQLVCENLLSSRLSNLFFTYKNTLNPTRKCDFFNVKKNYTKSYLKMAFFWHFSTLNRTGKPHFYHKKRTKLYWKPKVNHYLIEP